MARQRSLVWNTRWAINATLIAFVVAVLFTLGQAVFAHVQWLGLVLPCFAAVWFLVYFGPRGPASVSKAKHRT
jgi:hypothetical protein